MTTTAREEILELLKIAYEIADRAGDKPAKTQINKTAIALYSPTYENLSTGKIKKTAILGNVTTISYDSADVKIPEVIRLIAIFQFIASTRQNIQKQHIRYTLNFSNCVVLSLPSAEQYILYFGFVRENNNFSIFFKDDSNWCRYYFKLPTLADFWNLLEEHAPEQAKIIGKRTFFKNVTRLLAEIQSDLP